MTSDRSGNWDLWSLPPGGGALNQLTTELAMEAFPDWSPDGRQVLFHGNRGGNRDVWVMPAAGGPPRQLTTHEGEDLHAVWSPNGQRVAFVSDRSGNYDIWVVSLDGGAPVQVTVNEAADERAVWFPDDESIVFRSNRGGNGGLWRMPLDGGEVALLTQTESRTRPVFSPDGTTLYFVREDNLWALALDDREERQLTDLGDRRGQLSTLNLETDGHFLYFTWTVTEGDIWVADFLDNDVE